MIRNVDVNRYLPPVIKEAREFKKLAIAENPEFNLMWENIDVVWANQYIMELTIDGVIRWEGIIGIYPRISDTLEDRRIRILTYIASSSLFTITVLRNYLHSVCGEENVYCEINCVTYILDIVLYNISETTYLDVLAMLKIMIPANIVVQIQRTMKGNG